jgi:DNA-binding NarL/FixJ family response regulator
MIRVFISDDHAVIRRGLSQIVNETQDIAITGEASGGQETLHEVLNNHYDVALLDITMPDLSGLDVLIELKQKKPELPVLMLSIHPEEQYAIRALKAGASGYLTKDSAPEELVAAIRKVAGGEKYIGYSLAERLADIPEIGSEPIHQRLSNREYQVLCLIANGKTAGQIAEGLSLSTKTISTYRSRILSKMKMTNNAELTRYAVEHQLSL